MGGYGAARILALNPEGYRGMAAFSAPLAIEMLAMPHEQEPTLYAEIKFNYQEGDGGHEFNYWDRCINDWFKRISNPHFGR